MAHKCDGCRYKGEHREMMFRPFGVCTKELNLIEAEKAYNAGKCPYIKTNADRIRSMTDEELAKFICGIFDDDDDIGGKFINGYFIPCYDQYSIKEWLQQPTDEVK